MVRSYMAGDAAVLAAMHTAVFPDNPFSADAFHSYVSSLVVRGGAVWVIDKGDPLGYALAVPVPGLPHIADLKGCIDPSWRRQGFGTRLLTQVLADLRHTPMRQASCPVEDMATPAANFLCKNGFAVEHEEWMLVKPIRFSRWKPRAVEPFSIRTLPRSQAIGTFQALYTAAFSSLPWDQPFSRVEIASILERTGDLLFLMDEDQPVGFAWLHIDSEGQGLIEPLGVLPAYQGKGHGRYLLRYALYELARRGVTRARIGAWRTNHAALHLYHAAGFEHERTTTYLAYDLQP